MAQKTFELWYDVVCPYAYLGSTQIAALEADTGARAQYRPFLLGGVFKSFAERRASDGEAGTSRLAVAGGSENRGQPRERKSQSRKSFGDEYDPNAAMPPAKATLNRADMKRWARHFDVPLEMPSEHPRRTVLAMRAILAAGDARRTATDALFRAYWVEGRDVTEPSVVAHVLSAAGLDGPSCVERAQSPEIKLELRVQTDRAIERGVFGAPTFVVGDDLFWGQDRMHFVRAALR